MKSTIESILQFKLPGVVDFSEWDALPAPSNKAQASFLRCRLSGNLWQIHPRTMEEWKKIPKATQFSRWVINWWALRERNLSAKWLGKFLITFQWTGKYPRYLLDLLQRAVGSGRRLRDEINQIFRQESVYTLQWLFSFVWWRLDDFLVTQKKSLGAKIVSSFLCQ